MTTAVPERDPRRQDAARTAHALIAYRLAGTDDAAARSVELVSTLDIPEIGTLVGTLVDAALWLGGELDALCQATGHAPRAQLALLHFTRERTGHAESGPPVATVEISGPDDTDPDSGTPAD